MNKLLTLFMILALAIPAWAGTQTITISRNDGQFESSSGVYYASKGGVTMTMSGGLNNKNYLVLRHENTITFKSANFAIKEIIFHCLDDFPSSNLDVFFWGPTTMDVMTVNYKPVGSAQTQAITPGKYTASGYDGHWVSNYSGTWTSTFKGVTRTHTKFADGYPAGNTLTFESMGKPIRFSSIDIIIEKEDGDIYDLVTNIDQVKDQHNYLIVNWQYSKALSVNTKAGKKNEQVRTGSPVEFISGHVDDSGNYDRYAKVKTDGEAQIIKLEKQSLPISNSSGTINNDRPWLLNAGGNYLRITSSPFTGENGNNGPDLYGVTNVNDEWSYAKIELPSSPQQYGYNARIRFRKLSSTDFPRPTDGTYRISYNPNYNYFRDLDYQNYSNYAEQNIRLYTPAQNYNVTTEVLPDASKGSIALHDGVIVNDASATSGTSQQYEVVSFMVTAADGYKIANLTINELNPDGTLASTIEPTGSIHTTNGTLYTFTMPANDVHIIATFEAVEYHNIYIEVKPSADYGGVFLTDGYVVQNDQVKSYEGANVEFNVTPNLIDIDDESKGYHELYSVTVTYYENGQEISYTYTDGNYNFTMPDADVKITATFIYNNDNPLYLLGTANGGTWAPTGPRFNYDPEESQYYIDVYFKGDSGDYGDYTGGNLPEVSNGHFNVVWGKWSTWAEVNSNGRRGVPYDWDYFITENNPTYGLVYDDWKADQGYAFKIPAGIYRIYVKSYGYHNDQLTIVKYATNLSLDPLGGESAETALQVPEGTEVTMEGDIYNKIMAINPDEPVANFKYKAVKNGTADATVQSTTTATTTLNNETNQNETPIELNGYNYLGWIVADKSAYYKIFSTPLAWIEEKGEPGTTYTVADKLLIVWTPEEHADNPCADYGKTFWAKDLPTTEKPGGLSIVATSPNDGQVDYMMLNEYTARTGGWDQSNWIELDLSDVPDHGAAIGKYIAAGTLKGEYTSNLNYKMKVTSLEFTDDEDDYVPNTFCTANFLENNLTLTPESTGPQGPSGRYYYFLNPKVQEYAKITYAKWDKDNQEFVVPTFGNAGEFSGALKIGGWNYNIQNGEDVMTALDNNADDPNVDPDLEYEFRAIIHRENYNYGHSANASAGARKQQSSSNITVWPIDLQASSTVVTAVKEVNPCKAVSSVKYYDITGMESNKPFDGVNIVVTRYSDGTFTTSKVLR